MISIFLFLGKIGSHFDSLLSSIEKSKTRQILIRIESVSNKVIHLEHYILEMFRQEYWISEMKEISDAHSH